MTLARPMLGLRGVTVRSREECDGIDGERRRATPKAVADLLEQKKPLLLEKWAARVLGDPKVPAAAHLSRLALYDHFPQILDRIITRLRTADGQSAGAESLGATVADSPEAGVHVRNRIAADYSVPEVICELSHLRWSIIELCEHAVGGPDEPSATIIHAAFDHMMINAADELSQLELKERERVEQLARERAVLYERERRGREELEEAHRAKDDFLAMISHELRTPLNAIVGWSDLLARSAEDEALRARAIATIQRNAKAQAHLIDRVLDITRLRGGRMEMSRDPVDVCQLLRTTVESFRPALDEKALISELEMRDCAVPVLGDAQRLRQVFTNLLGNALKFTPKGGTIRVTSESDRRMVRVAISDSGVGISTEFLPHVFEPFRQADTSWSRQHGGLGLGLAITKALVELHGGTIEVKSDGQGTGATFTVSLPITTAVTISQPADAKAPSVARVLEGIRVLAVDDAPDTRELLERMLVDAGATVDLAGSGSEGIALAARSKPDVVVSDLAMPTMDGLTFLKRLRERVGDVPGVALSAFNSPKAIESAQAAGFERYLPKPLVMKDLLEAVVGAKNDAEKNATVQRKSDPARRSVLVVEDDRDIATELEEMLRERAYSVRVVHDGRKALDLLEKEGYRPNVILLDLMMPGMDGWTLRRKLLEDERLAGIPIVLVTGAPGQDVSEIERVEAVVRKPFDVRSLLLALSEGSRAASRRHDAD